MTKRIAILHYASPPTVGGVEATIAYHARGLAGLGYAVRVVSGAGDRFDARVEEHVNPLFGSKHPDILKVKAELDAGKASPVFNTLVEQIGEALRAALDGCDVCITHNVHTLHKNLALTTALARITSGNDLHSIAWCHDLAWTNPQYQPELHAGYPWDLLRQAWPRTRYVTVSEPRRAELAELLDLPPESIAVVEPGVDPARFFHWTATTQHLAERLGLLDADGLFLLPARLTRRKNIALALRVLAEVRRQSGRDFRLIVTGPPGPHNPANPGYLGELLELRRELGLDESAHFLYAHGDSADQPLVPDDDTMANLYQLADALLFPSIQEGFGIPVLEAGLAGLPVFCSHIPPFRKTGADDVLYFDPLADSAGQIAGRVLATLDAYPPFRLRVRVRQSYRWDAIIRGRVVPLVEQHG